jgi:thioredoxin domain-containing protein 5
MNAPQAPLVVIAAGPEVLREKIMERLTDVGKKWRVRTNGSGVVHGREVVFTWMDRGRWADWMKSMYGIKEKKDEVKDGEHDDNEKNLEDLKVVIADHSVSSSPFFHVISTALLKVHTETCLL